MGRRFCSGHLENTIVTWCLASNRHSISTALAVLSLGASSNTLNEILEGLKFNLTETPEADIHRGFGHLLHMLSQPEDQVQISTGSAMFVEKSLQLLAEFKEKARILYQVEATLADFQQRHKTKKLINDYVSKQTQGKIKELISDLDKETVMVLVNYIYFKGKWKTPFDPQDTFQSEFHLDKKRTVMVPMMNIEDLTTPYFRDEELSCSVVELKYTGNASALFILPDKGKMQQLEASLQPETLSRWKDSLRPRRIDELYLPKFSISTDYSLENILPQLGIREVFSTQADLSGITGAKNLKVSQVALIGLKLPISISTALAVLSLGASSNTLNEILEGLKFNLTETPEADIHRGFGHLLHMLSQPEDQVQISTGSAMFVEKSLQLLAEFKEKARVLYQAEATLADFQQRHKTIKLINDYVSKQTQGKIKELISDLDKETVMVLVNYIYFKGKWKTPFDPLDTFESEFHLDKKRTVMVPMMNIEDLTTPYFRDEELSCSVVELKYTGNASALFILPDEGKMQQLEASLQPETLKRWKDSLKPRRIDELYLPKFSISTDYSLENILPQLGIREVFSTQADLSGITGAKNLKVSQVVHKAVLDVAETGTEAAAATGVKVSLFSAKLDPFIVRFDRSFLITISDTHTHSVLFLAKITNPK
ncbi:hypothetical protein NN561_014855 [Cricetulus griseus]